MGTTRILAMQDSLRDPAALLIQDGLVTAR